MYSFYIPKYEKDSLEFKITKVIKHFMRITDYKNDILSSPGYLSTTPKTISDFVNEFGKNISDGINPTNLGYFHGMNGDITRRNTHYRFFARNCLKEIPIICTDKKDHRKMLFFFESNFQLHKGLMETLPSGYLDKKSKNTFLSNITVNAVLIGSSNQSYSTYYGGASGKAQHGEADLFMFNDKMFAKYLYECLSVQPSPTELDHVFEDPLMPNLDNFDGCVLFNSIIGGENAHDYFKNILDEFLQSSLA